MNFIERQQHRSAWVELTANQNFDTFITLAVNKNISIEHFHKLIGKFFGRLDRKLLGPNFHNKPSAMRTKGFAFIEHVSSNIHAHCLIKPANSLCTPSGVIVEENFLGNTWSTICPSGSLNSKKITTILRLSGYVTKEHNSNSFDALKQILVLEEFFPHS